MHSLKKDQKFNEIMCYARSLTTCMLLMASIHLSAQQPCKIKNRIGTDGTLYYYVEPVQFYRTSEKQLEGGLVTDKEHYFLVLQPYPFPLKKASEKLTDSLDITLSNNKNYRLENYYVHLHKEDSLLRMMYFIPTKMLDDFRNYEINAVKINMGDEGIRQYDFKLHKDALKEHLACFEKNQSKN